MGERISKDEQRDNLLQPCSSSGILAMRLLSLTAMVGVSLLSTMAILTWRALSVMMQNRVISAEGGRGAANVS